jgi:hypothetical protein
MIPGVPYMVIISGQLQNATWKPLFAPALCGIEV